MRILLTITATMFLIAVVPGVAQNPDNLVYEIEIEKGENSDNKVFASFRERDGKEALYVTVHFKVRRVADGQETTDVDKDDIVVREDGRRVLDLEIFSPRTALTTVLAMDISGSMENTSGGSGIKKIDEAKKAAAIFLNNLSAKSETGLVLFDHLMRVTEAPLRDAAGYAEHRRKIRQLIAEAQPLGGTAYLDAAAKSVDMLKDIAGRRAVVVMTDGVDMNSKRTIGEVIKLATVHQVPIYTLGIGELGKYKNVTTVLVLDHSGSMKEKADANDRRPKIEAMRSAASRFVELMRRDAKTMLQPFSSEVDEPPHNFTDDKKALLQDIQLLQPSGGTLLYDAANAGLETLAAARRDGRNAVVVLTDGRDEAPGSRFSDQLVIDRAKELGIPLYMLGLGQKEEINEKVMRRMAQETGGKYFHAGSEQKLFEIFEKLAIDLHDDGINEKELRELAEKTGGKFFWARDAAKLPIFFRDLASELQSTYTVTFPSRRSSHDGTARGIDISIERDGVRLSNVGSADYKVPGVLVPEMDYRIYLVLLALVAVFLFAPSGVRQLYRFYGGA
ncbi:MAG: vWA domain-containing protein [Gemmataceae bacterium]